MCDEGYGISTIHYTNNLKSLCPNNGYNGITT